MTDNAATTDRRPSRLLLIIVALFSIAPIPLVVGLIVRDSTVPTEGKPAFAGLVDVVRAELPDARNVTYRRALASVRPRIELDEVHAEFDLDGVTCTASVTGVYSGNQPAVDEPRCDGEGLARRAGRYENLPWWALIPYLVASAPATILVVAYWLTSTRSHPSSPEPAGGT